MPVNPPKPQRLTRAERRLAEQQRRRNRPTRAERRLDAFERSLTPGEEQARLLDPQSAEAKRMRELQRIVREDSARRRQNAEAIWMKGLSPFQRIIAKLGGIGPDERTLPDPERGGVQTVRGLEADIENVRSAYGPVRVAAGFVPPLDLGASARESVEAGSIVPLALSATNFIPGSGAAKKWLKKLKGGKWVILNATNPMNNQLPDAVNRQLHADLGAWVRQNFPDRWVATRGTEGAGKPVDEGFLIFLDPKSPGEMDYLVAQQSRNLKQAGIMTSDGLLDFTTNTLTPMKALRSSRAADPYFTQIIDESGTPVVSFGADLSSRTRARAPVATTPATSPLRRETELVRDEIVPLRDIGERYRTQFGMSHSPLGKVGEVPEQRGREMADVYEKLKSDPSNPEVIAAYKQFASEVREQAAALRRAGYTWSFVDKDAYKNSAEMLNDLRRNRHISVLRTSDAQRHPLLSNEDNNLFRAIHDIIGHGTGGNSFGKLGEELAYREHARLFSPLAQRVLATETRGQNSWFNFGPHRAKPASQRPFAPQKAALWPEEYLGDYDTMPGGSAQPAQRKIIGAAVRAVDGEYYTGMNHEDASKKAAKALRSTPQGRALLEKNKGTAVRLSEMKYFKTNDGSYIDRDAARELVRESGQAPSLADEWTQLHSSDVAGLPMMEDLNNLILGDRLPTSPFGKLSRLFGRRGAGRGAAVDPESRRQMAMQGVHLFRPGMSQKEWLSELSRDNKTLARQLLTDPSLGDDLFNQASTYRKFGESLRDFEGTKAMASSADPLYRQWYRGWSGAMSKYFPGLSGELLTRFKFLSAQKSPKAESRMALKALRFFQTLSPADKDLLARAAIDPSVAFGKRGELRDIQRRLQKATGATTPRAQSLIEAFTDRSYLGPRATKTSDYELASRGFTQTGALDRHVIEAYTGRTGEKAKLTPAEYEILSHRVASDARRMGMDYDEYQAMLWGGKTKYSPGFAEAGGVPEEWIGYHLATDKDLGSMVQQNPEARALQAAARQRLNSPMQQRGLRLFNLDERGAIGRQPQNSEIQTHPLFSEWAAQRPTSGETFDEYLLRKSEQERTRLMIPAPFVDYRLEYETFLNDRPRILEEQADARARAGLGELLADESGKIGRQRTLIRVEGPRGEGPYQSGEGTAPANQIYWDGAQSRQPTPGYELEKDADKLYGDVFGRFQRFAFRDVDQMRRWFTLEELDYMADQGFLAQPYAVSKHVYDNNQALFDIRDAQKVGAMPLTPQADPMLNPDLPQAPAALPTRRRARRPNPNQTDLFDSAGLLGIDEGPDVVMPTLLGLTGLSAGALYTAGKLGWLRGAATKGGSTPSPGPAER